MPTYDYACRDCGHRFDAVQSIHEDALTTCPECGGSLRRVVGAVGVQFKGSGFYMTDNRGKSSATTKSTGSESGGSGGKAEGKDAATKAPAESNGDGGSASTKTSAKSAGGSSSSDGA